MRRGSNSTCLSFRVNVRACCEGALNSSFVMVLGQGQHAKWNIRSHLGAGTGPNGATCWPKSCSAASSLVVDRAASNVIMLWLSCSKLLYWSGTARGSTCAETHAQP